MRYPETARLIKSARLRKGLSQERAALQVGCSRLQFIRWEQGLHRPAGHVAGLVDSLGVDRSLLEQADEDDEASALSTTAKTWILVALVSLLGVLLIAEPWTIVGIAVELVAFGVFMARRRRRSA